MVNLIVQGKRLDLTDALREYVEKKIGKLDKYSRHIQEINVELSVDKNPRIQENQNVEVTVSANGVFLRAQEVSKNMYAAIDLVAEKIERQLKKYEKKKTSRRTGQLKTSVAVTSPVEVEELAEQKDKKLIVQDTPVTVKPMSPEEAIEQMELTHHSFFIFRNQDTDVLNIVHKIKKDTYGLIILEDAA